MIKWRLRVNLVQVIHEMTVGLAVLGLVGALTIDNELAIIKNDCFERQAIGQRLHPRDIYKTVDLNTVPDCQRECTKEEEKCRTFSFGIGPKGNATCELSSKVIRETVDLKPIGTVTDQDYDLYIKKLGCKLVIEQKPIQSVITHESSTYANGDSTHYVQIPHKIPESYGTSTSDKPRPTTPPIYKNEAVFRPDSKDKYNQVQTSLISIRPDPANPMYTGLGPAYGYFDRNERPHRPYGPGEGMDRPFEYERYPIRHYEDRYPRPPPPPRDYERPYYGPDSYDRPYGRPDYYNDDRPPFRPSTLNHPYHEQNYFRPPAHEYDPGPQTFKPHNSNPPNSYTSEVPKPGFSNGYNDIQTESNLNNKPNLGIGYGDEKPVLHISKPVSHEYATHPRPIPLKPIYEYAPDYNRPMDDKYDVKPPVNGYHRPPSLGYDAMDYNRPRPEYNDRPYYGGDYHRPPPRPERPLMDRPPPRPYDDLPPYRPPQSYDNPSSSYGPPPVDYHRPPMHYEKPDYYDNRPPFIDDYREPEKYYHRPPPPYEADRPPYENNKFKPETNQLSRPYDPNNPNLNYLDVVKPVSETTSYNRRHDVISASNGNSSNKPISVVSQSTGPRGETITSIITEIKPTCFRRALAGKRVTRSLIRRALPCERVEDCQQECADEKRFLCEGFNYRLDPMGRGNGDCELLDLPLVRLDMTRDIYTDPDYDIYERDRNAECKGYYGGGGSGGGDDYPPADNYRYDMIDRRVDDDMLPPYRDRDDDRYRDRDSFRYGHRHRFYYSDRRYDDRDRPDGDGNYNYLPKLPYRPYLPKRPYDDRQYYHERERDRHYWGFNKEWDTLGSYGNFGRPYDFYGYRTNPNRRFQYNLPNVSLYGNSYGIPSPYDIPAIPYQPKHEYGLTTYGGTVPTSYIPSKPSEPGYSYPTPGIPITENNFPPVPGDSIEHKDDGFSGGHSFLRDECSLRSATGFRLHKVIVKKYFSVPDLYACELICAKEADFDCLSYAYRYTQTSTVPTDNCYIAEKNYRDLDFYTDLEPDRDYDVYTMNNRKRCEVKIPLEKEQEDCFYHTRSGQRLDQKIVRDSSNVQSVVECQIECIRATKFLCRGFSFRYGPPIIGGPVDNCLLTDWPFMELDARMHFVVEAGFEVYERGSYGHGCESNHFSIRGNVPQIIGSNTDQLCYVGYGSPARLLPDAIRKSVFVNSELECKAECSKHRFNTLFQCMSFSFKTNVERGEKNCDLSDILQRDLLHKIDYVFDPQAWLFAWDNFNPECVALMNRHKINTPPPPPPPPPYLGREEPPRYPRPPPPRRPSGGRRPPPPRYPDRAPPPPRYPDRAPPPPPPPPGHPDGPFGYIPITGLDTWRVFSVSGWPCKRGTKCKENREAGFWYCDLEGPDADSWDYCCRPDHQCGFSLGYNYPWCYVGPERTQWRKCSDHYYPYATDIIRRPRPKPFLPNDDRDNPGYLPGRPSGGFVPSLRPGGIYDRPLARPRPRPPKPSLNEYEDEFNKQFLDPPKPGGFGPPRFWPVSYLHKEPPPDQNVTSSMLIEPKARNENKVVAIQNLIEIIRSNDINNIQYQLDNATKRDDTLLVKIPLPTNFTEPTRMEKMILKNNRPNTIKRSKSQGNKRSKASNRDIINNSTKIVESFTSSTPRQIPVYTKSYITRANVTNHGVRHFDVQPIKK